MGLTYQRPFSVPFYESDRFKNMKISNILAFALQVSGEQSVELNRSDVWLNDHYKLFWAVTEYELEINRLPRFMEDITIETEATSYNKFFCYRDFRFIAENGELLLTIHASWVLMGLESRKVERVHDDIVAPYAADKSSKIQRSHKFKKELLNPEVTSYPVRFSDLDMNGHVNNAKYYDWAADMIDYDFRASHQPKKVYIKYNHEVRYGETVEALFEMDMDGLTSHHKLNGNATEIEIEWTKNNDE
ncbi:acyl-ACP thioesterase domain-containing protein [Lactococcus termiticola]|uniref:Acyl-ACP thioesterase n=1 Tax=Lactococcus termiticola TaxID=2169526 RepID=A0A2R5HGV8_9LACT|nr:acyl-ACP thioesterase domain-containing protein [Lactococcus termiticola]GBG97096.1 acyl-ACP thioesterase [Lactococcus termiticola]